MYSLGTDRLKAVLSMGTLPTHLRCSWTWLVVIKIIFWGTILKISFRTKTTAGLCSGCVVPLTLSLRVPLSLKSLDLSKKTCSRPVQEITSKLSH